MIFLRLISHITLRSISCAQLKICLERTTCLNSFLYLCQAENVQEQSFKSHRDLAMSFYYKNIKLFWNQIFEKMDNFKYKLYFSFSISLSFAIPYKLVITSLCYFIQARQNNLKFSENLRKFSDILEKLRKRFKTEEFLWFYKSFRQILRNIRKCSEIIFRTRSETFLKNVRKN